LAGPLSRQPMLLHFKDGKKSSDLPFRNFTKCFSHARLCIGKKIIQLSILNWKKNLKTIDKSANKIEKSFDFCFFVRGKKSLRSSWIDNKEPFWLKTYLLTVFK